MGIYNGTYRRTTFTLNRVDAEGASIAGYPVVYDITAEFESGGETFAALSASEFAQLSEADYATRLAAFYAYVDGENDDCDSEASVQTGYGPTGTDTVSCPIGQSA